MVITEPFTVEKSFTYTPRDPAVVICVPGDPVQYVLTGWSPKEIEP